jgi:hypothetical protein
MHCAKTLSSDAPSMKKKRPVTRAPLSRQRGTYRAKIKSFYTLNQATEYARTLGRRPLGGRMGGLPCGSRRKSPWATPSTLDRQIYGLRLELTALWIARCCAGHAPVRRSSDRRVGCY